MLIALTRPVSASLARCELTYLPRERIDVARAAAQHVAYERVLGALGATVVRVAGAPELPDAVFVEDAAVVLDELAVITRPGATARQAETADVAAALAAHRRLQFLHAPATLDGGDVLRLGRTLFVGRSGRTNAQGIEQLREIVAPFGYAVSVVEFCGCLHLKSAVTEVDDSLLLANPAWVAAAAFPGCEVLSVDNREPHAANALRLGGAVVYPSQYPWTREALLRRGLRVTDVDSSELAKAEGGVTCCSLVFESA